MSNNKAAEAREFLAQSAKQAMFQDSRKFVVYGAIILAAVLCGVYGIYRAFPALSTVDRSQDLGVTVTLFAAAVFFIFIFAFLVIKEMLAVKKYINSVEQDLPDNDAIELMECLRDFTESAPVGVIDLRLKCADGVIRPFSVPYTGKGLDEKWFDDKAIKCSGVVRKSNEEE